jgi:uncharacterized protein (DUF1697 family)
MSCVVAFLRGMNLGGRRLTNDTLRAAFEDMGFRGVTTFRASGNVIVQSEASDPAVRIEQGLEERLGYPVPTVVRTGARVRQLVAFDGLPRRGTDGGKLQVTLLRSPPTAEVRQAVLAHATDDDQLVLGEAELFWLPRGGVLDSTLDLGTLDTLLGLGTMRTMGTLDGIAKRCT